MTGPHDNGECIGYQFILRNPVKCRGYRMHGWSQVVSFQTQQQLANLRVGTGTYITTFFLKGFSCPGLQPPVFIIQENTSIFHRRSFRVSGRSINIQCFMLFYWNIGPPIPRRHPYHLGDGKQTISSSPPITPGYDQGFIHPRIRFVDRLNQISFPSPLQRAYIDFPLLRQLLNPFILFNSSDNNQEVRSFTLLD